MKPRPSWFLPAFLLALVAVPASAAPSVHQATGFKVVNVTATTADVWTRVTLRPAANPADGPLPEVRAIDLKTGEVLPLRDNRAYPGVRVEVRMPGGAEFSAAAGGAPAAAGQTRVRFRAQGASAWRETAWRDAPLEQDGTCLQALEGLAPGVRHEILVQVRRGPGDAEPGELAGGFTTSPAPGQRGPVTFCVMTCQQYEHLDRPDGLAIYPSMAALRPDFFINTGDALYYDHGPVIALTPALARYHWARMYALPTLREFHRQHSTFFMRDDHDTLFDDCGPTSTTGELTFADGVRLHREQTGLSAPAHRTFRWGRDLQVWLMEGRDDRTPDWKAKPASPPTLWGAAQIKWLEESLAASDATYRLVVVTVPVVGPDRVSKNDNYANAGFADEARRVRALLGRHRNLTVITGDRHWQYVSVDPASQVQEWSVGASSQSHAGGWDETKPRPEHRFLRTREGGFLSGVLTPAGDAVSLELRLHDVDGRVVYREPRPAGR